MKKITKVLFAILLLNIVLVIYIFNQSNPTADIQLTDEEKQYLQSITPIKMAVDPDWEPFEKLDEDGHYSGIAADYVALIEKRLDIQLEIVPTIDWGQSIEYSKAGKVTVLPFLNKTEEREKWLTFTEPLIMDDNAIIGRFNTPAVSDLAAEKNKTVALPEGTSVEERLREDFPNLHIRIVETEKEAFELVSKGQVDYTIRSILIASYNIRQQGWFDLKIVGKIPGYTNYLAMGVSKDETQLRDILNKAILSITEKERVKILNEHIPLRVETADNKRLLFILGSVMLVTLVLLIVAMLQSKRTKKLARKNKEIQEMATRYAALSQLAGTYFWQVNLKGLITYVSEEITYVLGYEVDELIGQSYRILQLSEKDGSKIGELIQTLESGQVVKNLESIERKKDGSAIWVKVNAMPVMDERNELIGYRGSCTDIELRKQLEQELIDTKDEIELAYYQAQITPHFLYNSLSAIAMYCLTEPKKASKLIVDLSFFLRKSFNFKSIEYFVTLEQELELIQSYINIEQVRFGHRLNIRYELDAVPKQLKLPPLILQPLIENAINHGIMKRLGGGTIILKAALLQDKVRFEVIDDGVGIAPEQIEQLQSLRITADTVIFERHGVGLKNIHSRLMKKYNSELAITLNTVGGTTVAFEIPITFEGELVDDFSNNNG